ncbi:MAG: AAA family ATPase [Mediterranea sp.]|jgi:predicted AAA+ superfamily ATPase|nr:AAA family ATPase [Mediterranea sp.]
MKQLFVIFYQLISRTSTDFVRYLYHEIRWDNRLIMITGARGSGKTTLMLQYIKEHYAAYSTEALYVSLDNIRFSNHTLTELADEFCKMGGKALFLDEVHKYPTWSTEVKNIYDSYPDLKIVLTGSSLLELYRGQADLSRRSVVYHLRGLSFREFLRFEYDVAMTPVVLDDILAHHTELAGVLGEKIKPLPAFHDYLAHGYFPFYKEDTTGYHQRLLATLGVVLEVDLPTSEHIDYYSIGKIKKLFAILAGLVPYVPNISTLSREIGVTRPTLLNYLYYLRKAQALMLLDKEATGMKQLAKPEKIYLGNTNYAYALGGERTDIGNVRETFFFNQMSVRHAVTYSRDVDFTVDECYQFEIGGKNKTSRQLSGLQNGYLAMDDIEIGIGKDIPLWLFGLLY